MNHSKTADAMQSKNTSLRTQAHALSTQGICPMPTLPGKKFPVIQRGMDMINLAWSRYKTRYPSPWEIDNWFPPSPPTGIGVILGQYSILTRDTTRYAGVCLDFDDAFLHADFERACRKDPVALALFQRAIWERTPRGAHLIGFVDRLYGNKVLALHPPAAPGKRCKAKLELKAHFIKIAPSPGYHASHGDWSAPPCFTAEEWSILVKIACAVAHVSIPTLPSKAVPLAPQRPLEQVITHNRYTCSALAPLSKEAFVSLLQAPTSTAKMAAYVGVPDPTTTKSCPCIFHTGDTHPSMTCLPPREGDSHRYYCHHTGMSRTLTQLFIAKCEDGWEPGTEPQEKHPSPSEYGVYGVSFLVQAGVLDLPDLPFPKLPKKASAAAQATYEATTYLYRVRSFRNDDTVEHPHLLPLAHKFLARFCPWKVSERTIRVGMRTLLALGFWGIGGHCDPKKGGRVMALFLRGSGRVRRALKEDPVTCDDTQSQEDILEAVGTVAAAVLADASPLRRAGQGEGVSVVYDPLTGEILSEEEYALWHEPL